MHLSPAAGQALTNDPSVSPFYTTRIDNEAGFVIQPVKLPKAIFHGQQTEKTKQHHDKQHLYSAKCIQA
jgi:hypothetical protein